MPVYSLCVTSCSRHDLLRQTLDSFIDAADLLPRYTLIVEDSDSPRPSWLSEDRYRQLGELKWLSNGVRMGQVYSLRRLYDEVTTDWAFHLEDDWLFQEQGFMGASFSILQQYPKISQVSLRGSDCNGHTLVPDSQYPFLVQEPYWRGPWGGWSWNPSLIRVSEARSLVLPRMSHHLGQAGLGHEADVSKYMLDAGYRIATIRNATSGRQDPHIQHIGGGRSRAIEALPDLPRILLAVPACHVLEYGQWESSESPRYDKANPAYGTDIHISGKNDRIEAVRDTWFKDSLPFSNVDARFFYGLPHNRTLAPDEVFLDVKDDYASLPFKTVAICKWALEQGYDYLLKCDDDTYVWVDRLVQEIMEQRMDYGGWEHSGVCTGGPGYILSKRAMKIIAESTPTHWAEDCHTGITLTNARIKPVMLPNHRPGFSAHFFDINKIPPRTVTIHAVTPADMRTVYQREHASIN